MRKKFQHSKIKFAYTCRHLLWLYAYVLRFYLKLTNNIHLNIAFKLKRTKSFRLLNSNSTSKCSILFSCNIEDNQPGKGLVGNPVKLKSVFKPRFRPRSTWRPNTCNGCPIEKNCQGKKLQVNQIKLPAQVCIGSCFMKFSVAKVVHSMTNCFYSLGWRRLIPSQTFTIWKIKGFCKSSHGHDYVSSRKRIKLIRVE